RSTTRKPAPGSLSPLASLRARLTPPGLPTINLDGRHRTTKRHPPPDSVRHEPMDSESCTDPRHSHRNFIERETQVRTFPEPGGVFSDVGLRTASGLVSRVSGVNVRGRVH